MVEKIGIKIMKSDPCDGCNPKTCDGGCYEKYVFDKGISKEKIIDKMAKAMYERNWKNRTPLIRINNWEYGLSDRNKRKYLQFAEVAFNVLVDLCEK